MQLTHLFTEEQKAVREMMRKFVDQEIVPVQGRLERDHSLVETILKKLVVLGIQKGGLPPEYGGTGPHDSMTRTIIMEELARGDAGISANAISSEFLGPALYAGNKAVLERFAPAFCREEICYGCLAMSDAQGGSDTENPLLEGRRIFTRAKLEGDEYVINGTKSWPTNAGKASLYLTVCTTNPDDGVDGIALIYVPPDAPGLSFGKPEKKLGLRTTHNASIFYDNVRVPKEYRLSGPGADAQFYYGGIVGMAQTAGAVSSLGMAQAAFDIVLEYTKERKSGGKPIREWSMVAAMIADMSTRLEIMKALIYNMAWIYDHPEDYGSPFTNQMISRGSQLRLFSSESCVFIVTKAMQLMGANGVSEDYRLEKILRDALTSQVPLGGLQVTRYRAVRGYYDYVV